MRFAHSRRWHQGGVVVLALALLGALGAEADATTPSGGCSASSTTWTTSCVFAYSGADESWTVPAGVWSIEVSAVGGNGGLNGGLGASVSAWLPVTPGEQLTVAVAQSASWGSIGNSGGFGGGAGNPTGAGAGGGASSLSLLGGQPLLVAGGGGGGGSAAQGGEGAGGAGGNAGAPGDAAAALTVNGVTIPGGGGGGGGTSAGAGQGGAGGFDSSLGCAASSPVDGASGLLGQGGLGGIAMLSTRVAEAEAATRAAAVAAPVRSAP